MFAAGAPERVDRLLFSQLLFADWAGFGHYIHDRRDLSDLGSLPQCVRPAYDVARAYCLAHRSFRLPRSWVRRVIALLTLANLFTFVLVGLSFAAFYVRYRLVRSSRA